MAAVIGGDAAAAVAGDARAVGHERVATVARRHTSERAARDERVAAVYGDVAAERCDIDPAPVAQGRPATAYPWFWDVYSWVEGTTTPVGAIDAIQGARDLAAFIAGLQQVDPSGAPPGRGIPLAARDKAFRYWLARFDGDPSVTAEWERALAAPPWDGAPIWHHGDLDVRNWLIRDGRISGVIDWACMGVGDPACDVMVAWKLHSPGARDAFREALPTDDATWERARRWVVSQAVAALAYYTPENNLILYREAESWLELVLSERMIPRPTDWRSVSIDDGVVCLRAWSEADLDEAFRDPELGRYFGSAITSASTVDDEMPAFAIVAIESGRVVGQIWCRPGARPPEIGYYLRRDAWGHGYATRALSVATDWLLGDGGFSEVELCTHPENERSQKVAERSGYKRDGIVDEYAQFKDGTRRALRFVRRK